MKELKPLTIEVTLEDFLESVASNLTDSLFELGDEYMSPTFRIEFKGKHPDTDSERSQGGLCKESLNKFLAEQLKKEFDYNAL